MENSELMHRGNGGLYKSVASFAQVIHKLSTRVEESALLTPSRRFFEKSGGLKVAKKWFQNGASEQIVYYQTLILPKCNIVDGIAGSCRGEKKFDRPPVAGVPSVVFGVWRAWAWPLAARKWDPAPAHPGCAMRGGRRGRALLRGIEKGACAPPGAIETDRVHSG